MFNGSNLLLYIWQDGLYVLLEGLKVTRFNFSNQLIDITSKNNGNWRMLASGAGTRGLSLMAGGIYTGSKAEKYLCDMSWKSLPIKFKLSSESGSIIEGQFIVMSYERFGNIGEEEGYSIMLESSGEVLQK